jgi:general stress protein 26
MKQLKDEVVEFFQGQGCVIVSTVDKEGSIHSSCKGILKINQNGRIYLLDLYQGKTFYNLKANPHLSITAVNEHSFIGYCLKGKAKIIKSDSVKAGVLEPWDAKITHRLTHRIIRNIQGEKGHSKHPEALLPKPEYMIVMEVEAVVDLTPHHLREETPHE